MKQKNCKVHGLLSEKDIKIVNKKYLICKLCKKETNKKWAKKNPERVKCHTKKWQKKNPEKIRNNMKKWERNNPEIVKDRNKKYKEKHREVLKSKYKETIIKLPDWYVARNLTKLLKYKEIPKELIEAKRLLMKIKRKLKEKT